MTRVLVTGAGGYIGGHVMHALAATGVDVVGVDLPSPKRAPQDLPIPLLEADIFEDPVALIDEVGPVDVCLHLAWEAGFVHDAPTHMLRLSDHVRFLDAVVAAGTPRLAVLGTMHEVGYHHGVIDETTRTEPRTQYGIAKDALRRSLGLKLMGSATVLQWLRCFYIYGDDARNNSIFTKIIEASRAGRKTFPFTTGSNKYDFLEVRELAWQITATILQGQVTGVINCCSGTPVSLGERVEEFIRENDLDIALEYGAFPDRPYDSPAVWGDATKIREILSQYGGRPL